MPHLSKRALYPLLLLALVGATIGAAGCKVPAVTAATPASIDRSITVLGRSSVSAPPDLVLTSVGVETYAATVGEATEQSNKRMEAVIASLGELGVAEKDIQTSNFSINSERRGSEDTNILYRVSNMVQVKVRDLDKVSEVLDVAVQAGANQVWGVTFTIEAQKALEDEARTKAMEDARRRAEALAGLAGVELGQVLVVAESGTVSPLMAGRGLGAGSAMAVEEAAAVPISPGEVQVTYHVQVTYAVQ